MTDWNRYLAKMYDKIEDRNFDVFVYGVTIVTARSKLVVEYPRKRYVIRSLDLSNAVSL